MAGNSLSGGSVMDHNTTFGCPHTNSPIAKLSTNGIRMAEMAWILGSFPLRFCNNFLMRFLTRRWWYPVMFNFDIYYLILMIDLISLHPPPPPPPRHVLRWGGCKLSTRAVHDGLHLASLRIEQNASFFKPVIIFIIYVNIFFVSSVWVVVVIELTDNTSMIN